MVINAKFYATALWRSIVLGSGIAAQAGAQVAPAPASSDRVVYEAAYYESFAPRTALDMISQTPGFVLASSESNDERRGFAGAVGNVLIDGQRPGAKSQSLQDVLGRVAAKEVIRIEVLRGSAVAGDASGAAVLANVIRTPAAGGGTWEAGFEYTNEDKPMPNGKFGYSGRKDATEYSVGGSAFTHDHDSAGWFDLTDGAGDELGRRRDDIPHQNAEYSLNGQVAFPAGDGRLAITGLLSFFKHDEQVSQLRVDPAGAQQSYSAFPFGERTRTAESGVTWQTLLGGWDTNVVGLVTRKFNKWEATATAFDANDVWLEEYFQNGTTDTGETIVRGTFARSLDSGRLEFGGEAAVNTLDSEQDLTGDTGEGPQPVDLANANLSVEETRGEAFVNHSWRLNPLWALDSRMAVETSRLSFSGDTEQSVSLTYVKPRVQLTRQLGKHQLQVRVLRDVGQLDFNDFVSTAAFVDDIIEGGNPDLRPQTHWAFEIDADLRFPGDAALRLHAFKNFVRDVVDYVPVGPPGEQFDAPGNIGDGTIVGTELSLNVPLGRVMKGGTLSVSATWQDSDVRDPLTGQDRPFSNLTENEIVAELRQDLQAAKFAWGASYVASSMNSEFRLNEINRFAELHKLNLFVETTWIADLKLRFEMHNVTGSDERRLRRLWIPDRNGSLLRRESGGYSPGQWWMLTMSSHF